MAAAPAAHPSIFVGIALDVLALSASVGSAYQGTAVVVRLADINRESRSPRPPTSRSIKKAAHNTGHVSARALA
jgi:hypothetical protein